MSLNGFVFGNKRVRYPNRGSVCVSKELKKEKIASHESHLGVLNQKKLCQLRIVLSVLLFLPVYSNLPGVS